MSFYKLAYSGGVLLRTPRSNPSRRPGSPLRLRWPFNYYETTMTESQFIIMLKSILKKSRDLIITSAVFGSALYAYIYYQSEKNKVQYLEALKSDTLKDASRLSNDSFGISWGFQADDTIMSRIDSGDLLFIRFECHECISANSMINCYLKTSHYLEE